MARRLFLLVFLMAGFTFFAAAQAGSAWAWGAGEEGTLGYVPNLLAGCSGYTCQYSATQIEPDQTWTQVTAGNYYTVGLKNDGTVWVWGFNADGELALGYYSYNYACAPIQVAALSDIVQVAAGAKHILALRADGTVWSWGSDYYGELGAPANGNCGGDPCGVSPVQVEGPNGSGFLTSVKAISAGVFFSVALKTDGTVWTWGSNVYGTLGNNTAVTSSNFPVQVVGINGRGSLPAVSSIGQGSQAQHVLAILSNGNVVGWGNNAQEQLSRPCNSAFCQYPYPLTIIKGFNSRFVATGEESSYAILTNGLPAAWGGDSNGELGIGTIPQNSCGSCQLLPTPMAGIRNVTAIAAGFVHALAVLEDGTVWSFGFGAQGQLGIPYDGNLHPTPLQVPGIANASSVGAGESNSFAISTTVLPISVGFAPDQVSLPNTAYNHTSAPVSFTVNNTGSSALVLSSVITTDTDPSHASYSSEFQLFSPPTFPVTINPGKSQTFSVVFTPTGATGCAGAIFQFATNAPNSPNAALASGCPIQ